MIQGYSRVQENHLGQMDDPWWPRNMLKTKTDAKQVRMMETALDLNSSCQLGAGKPMFFLHTFTILIHTSSLTICTYTNFNYLFDIFWIYKMLFAVHSTLTSLLIFDFEWPLRVFAFACAPVILISFPELWLFWAERLQDYVFFIISVYIYIYIYM